jgi:hypothetical protein
MKQLFTLTSIFREPRRLRRSKIVKVKIALLCAAFASASLLSAQVNCPTASATTSAPMVCQYPYSGSVLALIYYGGNLPANPQTDPVYQTLYLAGSATATPINASIATQLAQLPMPSAAAGTVTLKLPGSDIGSPFNNLGPILTDRPDTFPRRKFFLGFAYQHFNFTEIDGLQLSSFDLGAQVGGVTLANQTGTFYGALQSKVNLSMDQYIGLLTYGITRSTDVTVAVPVNNVTMNVTSNNYQGYFYSTATSTYTVLTAPGITTQVPLITGGSASGVGDVTVNVKQMLFGQEGRYAGALGAQLRFPTGDADNYLGSGAYGANVYGVVEYRGTYKHHGIAPHVKIGYQWNGQSQILDIQNPPHEKLPGGLDYGFGADFGLFRTFTLVADGVGHQYVNAPSLNAGTISLVNVPANQTGIIIPSSIPYSTSANTTYTTFNFSGGFKWILPKTHEHLLLYANVMVPVNDVGLHSDPVPMVGIAFKK